MTARWYIVHAYSNFEKKVAEDIEAKAKQKGLSELIEQIVVPTEKIVEVRRGRKVDAERKFFRVTCWFAQPSRMPSFHLLRILRKSLVSLVIPSLFRFPRRKSIRF